MAQGSRGTEADKSLVGNKKKNYGAVADPKPSMAPPKCPTHLKGEARREWRRMVDELTEAKMLARIDGHALAVYCQLWGRWVEAEKRMAEPEFEMITYSERGVPRVSYWYKIAVESQRQMLRYLSEFGMTPASRTRIRVELEPDEDEYEVFLRKGGG